MVLRVRATSLVWMLVLGCLLLAALTPGQAAASHGVGPRDAGAASTAGAPAMATGSSTVTATIAAAGVSLTGTASVTTSAATATPVPTATVSATLPGSLTPPSSASASPTSASSATITATATGSVTATMTATPTATATAPLSATATPVVSPTATPVVSPSLLSAPLAFEPNEGQSDPSVAFLAHGAHYGVFLSASGVELTLLATPGGVSSLGPLQTYTTPTGTTSGRHTQASTAASPSTPLTATRELAVRLRFLGADPLAQVTGVDPLPGVVNYFQGADPSAWITNVPTFAQVAVQGVYPGVDLRYHSTDGQVEYDWQVAAGVDPGVIRLALDGAQGLTLDARGTLTLPTAAGPLQQPAPVAYQDIGGQRHAVDVRYTLLGAGQIGFTLGAYNHSQPLVIDPVLRYATYLGGNNTTRGDSIAVDSQGNSYITGLTYATNYLTTSGAFSTTTAGNGDAFVTKLAPHGDAVLYSTYLGGSGYDESEHIAVDAGGDAYLAGYTSSSDFPTVHALQSTYGGGSEDAFVAALNPSGSALLYSTYLGGSGQDYALGLALDGSGDVYVTGDTTSTNFMTTAGVVQPSLNGPEDGFVTKLDPAQSGGASLLYSTYLGGSSTDRGNGIAVDASGDAYVVGDTVSPDFPTTANAVQPADGAIDGEYLDDGFMTELNPTASALLYSTYIGSSGIDTTIGVAVGTSGASQGLVYVTGQTRSFSFPFSSLDPGAYQPGTGGGNDAFVTALNPAKSGNASLVYSTFLGGFGDDLGAAIVVDSAGDATIGGQDNNSFFGTKPFPYVHPLQGVAASNVSTGYVAHLNPTGSALLWSTPLGGSGDAQGDADAIIGLALDSQGDVLATGYTYSPDFPVSGALQPVEPPCEAAFVAKIAPLVSGGTVPWHPHHSINLAAGVDLSVDLADGHADLGLAAMHIPGRGPAISVGTTWDSALAAGGAGTLGWTSSLTPSMGGVLTATVLYTDSSGAVWPFRYTGALNATPPYTSYATPAGLPWQLYTSASGYELVNVLTGESLHFDSQGRYAEDEDSYGNYNVLTFGSAGPNAVVNSGGRAVRAYYNGSKQFDALQSPLAYATGNKQGQVVAYGYTGAQLTSQVWGYGSADAVGATFGYSGALLTSVTVGIAGSNPGRTWTLGYDGQGRLVTVSSPVSGSVGQVGYTPAYTTQFTYDEGQTVLTQGAGTSGALVMTDTLDGAGAPLVTQDGLGHRSNATYDTDHDVLSSTDPNNNTTTNYYQYVGPNGSTGLITETVAPAIQPYSPLNGGMDHPTTYHIYNATTNDLIETDLPEGGRELYGYDGHHSVITSTELLNSTTGQWRGTINSYDPYGELTSVTDGRGVSVNSGGFALLNGQAGQYTRHLSYDTQGDQSADGTAPITTTLNGTLQVDTPVTTTYGYDADGNQTSVQSANGQTTTYGYDHLGRLTTTTLPAVTLYTGGTIQPVETTRYDLEGNVAQQTDGNGDVTQDSYDPWNRLVAETNPVSGTTVYTYNATEQTAVQDPMGNVTTDQYDAAGRLITETAPQTGTEQYAYDPAGNTTAITTADATNGTNVQVETRGYDALDRVLTDTISGPSQPPTTTLTRYDHDGNVFQVQQPNGDVTVNTYDLADQLTNTQLYMAPISGPSGATGPSYDAYNYGPAGNQTLHMDADGRSETTQYDGDNRVAQTVDTTSTGTITTTPQYDPDGNALTQTMQTVDLTQPGVQQTHTLTGTYNAADWTTSTGDDGVTTSYGYDAAGQERTQTILNGQAPVTAVLDPEGRATAIGENLGGTGPYSSTFAYNADDLPTTVTLHSDTPSKQAQQIAQYDRNSELTHLTASGPSGVANPLASVYDYAYNAAGWTTAMTWSVNGAITATQLTHNALGRLTSWTGQVHGPESWAYDGNGNIISNTEFISDAIRTTVFTYDTATPNQLDQQQTAGLGIESYTYDQHGDTTSLSSTDPPTYPNGQIDPYHVNIHVGYDAEERPLTVTTLMNGAPITATLAYNAAGLRSRYTVISGTATLRDEHFQYRDGLLGQDIVVSGTQTYTDTFIYNPGGLPLELIRQQNGTTSRYWYVLDGRGNVVALTDVNGNVVDRYAYDPWGEGLPEGTSETVRQPLRYGGYWWDQEVGWYWVTTRYYDPEGRWLQPDSSEIDGVHTYVYVGDDPIDLTDPLGLGGFCDVILIGGAGCWLGNAIGSWWNAHTEVAYAPASEQDLVRLEAEAQASGTGSQLSDINAVNVALFTVGGGIAGKAAEIGLAFVGKKLAETLVGPVVRSVVARILFTGVVDTSQEENIAYAYLDGLIRQGGMSLNQVRRIRAISVAVDRTTGTVWVDVSGEMPSEAEVNEILRLRAFVAKLRPRASSSKSMRFWQRPVWDVENCAEFHVCNQAINEGAKLTNIDISTFKISVSQGDINLTPFARCRNCRITTFRAKAKTG